MMTSKLRAIILGAIVVSGIGAHSADAQTIETLHSFTAAEIGSPGGGLVFDGTASTLYGTTSGGASKKTGTIFSFVPVTGVLTTLHTFTGADGYYPTSPLVWDSAGNLYGVTKEGGPNGTASYGTIFKINPATNVFASVHSFSGSDGAVPFDGLIFDRVHNLLYGTTSFGGSTTYGTIFKYDLARSALSTVYTFTGVATQAHPDSGLTLDGQGQLYGTTMWGGSGGHGTQTGGGIAYRLDPTTGAFTALYNFCTQSACIDGFSPSGTMVLAPSIEGTPPMLYGTTQLGGGPGACPSGCGVLFQINSATGAETILHVFEGIDGEYPGDRLFAGGLIADSQGRLYGTSFGGGMAAGAGYGTVFEYDPTTGAFSTLAAFNGKNGKNPNVQLALDPNGAIYGESDSGGRYGHGTIFKIVP